MKHEESKWEGPGKQPSQRPLKFNKSAQSDSVVSNWESINYSGMYAAICFLQPLLYSPLVSLSPLWRKFLFGVHLGFRTRGCYYGVWVVWVLQPCCLPCAGARPGSARRPAVKPARSDRSAGRPHSSRGKWGSPARWLGTVAAHA